MIKRKYKRKNPEIIYDEGMENLAKGLIFGTRIPLVNAMIYYNQGYKCDDCDERFNKCRCEYCDDCGWNRCLCDLEIDNIENDDEKGEIIRKTVWKFAKKVLKDDELKYLVNLIFYSKDLGEWGILEMKESDLLKKLHKIKSDSKQLRKIS